MRALDEPITAADLGQVFVTHRMRLKQTAHRILGDAHVAEDLVHDACVKVLEGALQGAGDAGVREPLSFAVRMVRNLAIDRHRRGALESRLFDTVDDEASFAAPHLGTPEAEAMGRQELALVAEALAQLPERVRRVFELYRIEGLTQREIGDQLGISAATVNSLIREALDHCRARLRRGG
jgi:RNA polymerase sigma-70 factor (ECF subfamily)